MKDKKFDAVKLMRDIRNDLSQKYSKLTIEQQIEELNKKFPEIKWKNLHQDKVVTK